jgi:TRAP-type uncharacterized transport system substrate-binding protein
VASEYPDLVDQVHFVPLDHPKILEQYASAEISPGDYPWFNSTIPTVAVKAVLICHDFSSRLNDYYRQRCDALFQLGQVIRNNINELKETGHPKWKEVNLDEKIGLWEWDSCSKSNNNNVAAPESELSRKLLEILKGKKTSP